MRESILITGLGIVSALGVGKTAFFDGLRTGQSGIKQVTVFDTTGLFPYGGEVGEVKEEGATLDRASRMLHMALQEALPDSGLHPDCGYRVGAVVGSAQGGLRSGETIQAQSEKGERVAAELWREYPLDRLLEHIATAIPLTGPELVVSNACVSSTIALGVAMDALADGLADVMIVAGVDCLSRMISAGFQALTAVTENVCRPFDANRDGIIPGEGAGVLILERAEVAKRRGARAYANLSGYGMAGDAVHMTAPDKEARGAIQAIKMALVEAGLAPQAIDAVIPHGTGTSFNDQMECVALEAVFGPGAAGKPVSSIKSAIGHTMGATGIMSAITAVLALREGILPANLNYETPDSAIPLNILRRPMDGYKCRHVLIMTSAFGGSNAVAIVSQPDYQTGSGEG